MPGSGAQAPPAIAAAMIDLPAPALADDRRSLPSCTAPAGRPAAGRQSRPAGVALCTLFALFGSIVVAAPVTPDELATLCAEAEDPAHCARLVEGAQLKRLPNLATRDGVDLKVSLYPSGTTTFTDDESPGRARSHSLWDFISEINAVVLYTAVGDQVTFTIVQRANGKRVELPAEPKVAPDRARLATADFCATRCVNELALWRIGRDGIVPEAVWKPAESWTDAVVTWKDATTLRVEYTAGDKSMAIERRLDDPAWTRTAPR
jgi:hypothetical protein